MTIWFYLLALMSGESLELNLVALKSGEQGADVVRPNKKNLVSFIFLMCLTDQLIFIDFYRLS